MNAHRKAYQRQLVEDRERLMADPSFVRVLFEIYTAAGITRITREEQQRLFLEGKRSLGLEILGWFSTDAAEPNDIIARAIAARNEFTPPKGTTHDDRDDPYE